MENKIIFMDGFDSVRDMETQSEEIFTTKLPADLAELTGRTHIPEHVIDFVVNKYNLYDLTSVDQYLLDEERITQDEREIIMEALYKFTPYNNLPL